MGYSKLCNIEYQAFRVESSEDQTVLLPSVDGGLSFMLMESVLANLESGLE